MKAPFSWLKDYVDIDVSAQELAEKLFSCGFEVEELSYLGEKINRVVCPQGYGGVSEFVCASWYPAFVYYWLNFAGIRYDL